MPLIHSSSPSAFEANKNVLLHEAKAGTSPHVKSREQALAIAYDIKRRGRAMGGPAPERRRPVDLDTLLDNQPYRFGTKYPPVLYRPEWARPPASAPDMVTDEFMGGVPHGRGFAPGGFASPSPPTPWQVRAEARGMHTGPILSAVAGRTDHHPMNVPAGAYVLPADHVSSMGQGNTVHGMAVLNHMFHSGPYGGAGMAMRRASGMRIGRAPLAKFADGGSSDSGGARGSEGSIGKPIPINAAGGEFIIPPHVVAAIGGGNIKHGHAILDHWVVSNRKNHINTLRKLPGPAKS